MNDIPEDDLSSFDAEKLQSERLLVMRGFAKKLKSNVGKIPFANDVTAAFYCALDSNTPKFVKAVLFGALAYFIIPSDVIPDFIAGLGFTDDAGILLAAMRTVQSHINEDHRDKAKAFLEE